MDDGDEVLDLLARRRSMLASLAEAPREKPVLVEATGLSRSTVDRAVRELEAAGLVERRDDGYAATATGRLVSRRDASFREDLADLAAAQPLLDLLPADAPVAAAAVLGAEVHLATPPEPHRAYDPLLDLLSEARRVCALSPSHANPETRDLLYERTVEEGCPVEFVFQRDLADHLLSEHPEAVRAGMVEGEFRPFAHPSVPFGLAVGYGTDAVRCALVVYDERGDLAGVAVNDDPDALDWAERVFWRFRSEATALSPPDEWAG